MLYRFVRKIIIVEGWVRRTRRLPTRYLEVRNVRNTTLLRN
jgi:hypothetical protein